MQTNDKIIFIHIHKTAGISIRRGLNIYLGDAVVPWYEQSSVYDTTNAVASLNQDFQIFFGHKTFGAHNTLHIPPRYATFLRNPVDRVISFYRYIRNNRPDHPLYEALNSGMPVREFAERTPRSRNYMVQAVSGIPGPYHTPEKAAQALEIAKTNLNRYFVFTGLYEYLHDDMARFASYLGIDGFILPHFNTGHSIRQKDVNENDMRTLSELNRFDEQLYDHVLRLRS